MDKEDKKKEGEIDEQHLMSMMAGGVRREGFANSIEQVSGSSQSEPALAKKKKTEDKRQQPADYETLFLSDTHGSARNGKSVYIRPEFHERLMRIVQVIGEDKISLYAYLDNILEYHFREFGEQIKKSFDDKYKPIF